MARGCSSANQRSRSRRKCRSGRELEEIDTKRGGGYEIAATRARQAAQNYLAAHGVTGQVQVSGTEVSVTVNSTVETTCWPWWASVRGRCRPPDHRRRPANEIDTRVTNDSWTGPLVVLVGTAIGIPGGVGALRRHAAAAPDSGVVQRDVGFASGRHLRHRHHQRLGCVGLAGLGPTDGQPDRRDRRPAGNRPTRYLRSRTSQHFVATLVTSILMMMNSFSPAAAGRRHRPPLPNSPGPPRRWSACTPARH